MKEIFTNVPIVNRNAYRSYARDIANKFSAYLPAELTEEALVLETLN